MKTEHVLKEAIIVGFLTVFVGTLIGKIFKSNVPSQCKNWNKHYVMEKSLFLTGFFIHIICEYFGINKFYCKYGSACSY